MKRIEVEPLRVPSPTQRWTKANPIDEVWV
jgi:hypothetical protein